MKYHLLLRVIKDKRFFSNKFKRMTECHSFLFVILLFLNQNLYIIWFFISHSLKLYAFPRYQSSAPLSLPTQEKQEINFLPETWLFPISKTFNIGPWRAKRWSVSRMPGGFSNCILLSSLTRLIPILHQKIKKNCTWKKYRDYPPHRNGV